MKSSRIPSFRRHFDRLSRDVQDRARESYRKFQDDPNAPGLRLKVVATNPNVYSIRVGRAHRALGVREGDEMIWFWIGDHADYDRLVASLQSQ